MPPFLEEGSASWSANAGLIVRFANARMTHDLAIYMKRFGQKGQRRQGFKTAPAREKLLLDFVRGKEKLKMYSLGSAHNNKNQAVTFFAIDSENCSAFRFYSEEQLQVFCVFPGT